MQEISDRPPYMFGLCLVGNKQCTSAMLYSTHVLGCSPLLGRERRLWVCAGMCGCWEGTGHPCKQADGCYGEMEPLVPAAVKESKDTSLGKHPAWVSFARPLLTIKMQEALLAVLINDVLHLYPGNVFLEPKVAYMRLPGTLACRLALLLQHCTVWLCPTRPMTTATVWCGTGVLAGWPGHSLACVDSR